MPIISDGPGFTQTAYVGYSAKVLPTTDTPPLTTLQLYYPNTYQDYPPENLLSFWSDFNCTTAVGKVILPPSNQVSVGYNFIFRNTGDETFTVYYNDGITQVATIAEGVAVNFIVIDNSSANGQIANIVYGVGSSSSDAVALAGYGLSAFQDGNPPSGLNRLNTSIPVQVETNPTISDIDNTKRGQLIVYNGGGICNCVMPNPHSFSQGGDGYYLNFFNNSASDLILRPANGSNVTFNGNLNSFLLDAGTGVEVVWDATTLPFGTWWCLGNVKTASTVTIEEGGTGQTTKPLAFNALSPLAATGQLLTYNANTNTSVPATTKNASGLIGILNNIPQFSGLSIIQVKSAAKTTASANISSADYVYSGLGVNFTPAYANSQIWIMVTINIATDQDGILQLQKITPAANIPTTPPVSGTPIVVGTTGATTRFGPNTDNSMRPYTIIAQDTSLFTAGSSYTYSVWVVNDQNVGNLYINRDTANTSPDVGCSSIAIFEIGGF